MIATLNPIGKSVQSLARELLRTAFATLAAVAFTAQAAQITFFEPLGLLTGSYVSGGNGVNNAGQVVGTSTFNNSAGTTRATLWSSKTPIMLSTLGGNNARAAGINESGQVVGSSDVAGDLYSTATTWTSTGIISSLDQSVSWANDINSAG